MNDIETHVENEMYHQNMIARLCSCGDNVYKCDYAVHLGLKHINLGTTEKKA